ncbi:MAG: aspartate-semialdehyde dehydrogenase [bacterium]|nr:aspartate-semialdehyde dehydrogenase [bacterium]
MKKYKVIVVGATGAVGREMIRTLENRNFPIQVLKLLASSRSAGSKIKFKNNELTVEELNKNFFKGFDIAIFSAGGDTSKKFAPYAAEAGCYCIDNSSAWRMEKDIPLVVPEVNPEVLQKGRYIIANPNCSTIQMVVALKPIHDLAKIKRVVVSTYQAVSGAGQKGILDLKEQLTAIENGETVHVNNFQYQIANNLIPHIDVFMDDGYTKEEVKMIKETNKILNDFDLKITATTVRVPVYRGHAESINIETKDPLSAKEAKSVLSKAAGVIVQDDLSKNEYPMPISSEGKYETFVGRIREDKTVKNGLNIWVVSDNLLKGAASNAVQIAETLVFKGIV